MRNALIDAGRLGLAFPGRSPAAPLCPGPLLTIDGIVKQFGERAVLAGASLSLRRREVLALCGQSGAGKTTLLRIVCGLLDFDGGRLAIAGDDIAARAPYPKRLYGKIGLIFQGQTLFPHMTALANVTLALREVRRLPLREATGRGMAELDRMGVASLAHRYPATLSGGEAQRVALARALAMDPLLLLLDEPTAHLDADGVSEVCGRILELADGGTTMLLVTHNLAFAREVAHTYALLDRGTCQVSHSPALLDEIRVRPR